MEQIVTVKSLYPDGTALVRCRRISACAGNCDECGGCSEGQPRILEVRADNPIGARPGDRVVLRSETGPILGAVAVVYMLPLVLLLTGCVLAGLWGALAGILLSAAGIVVIDRCRGKKTVYTVTDFAPDRADV